VAHARGEKIWQGPPVPVSGRKLLGYMLGAFIALAASFSIPMFACRAKDPQLDDLGTIPPFTLTDNTGQVFTEEALRGHPTIIDFVFTRCDTICPVVSARMQRLQEALLDRKGDSIKLISITVDPAYDTPEKLAVYAQRFSANPEKWRFLTGPTDKIRVLVEGPFMNSMINEGLTPSGAPAISHNGHFVLVDGDLHIRGVYDSADITRIDELNQHARFLARVGEGRSYKFGK
jgi:protein SCO1/2